MKRRSWIVAGLLSLSAICGVSAYELYQAQAAPIPHPIPVLAPAAKTIPIPISTQKNAWPAPNGVIPARLEIPAIGVNAKVQHVGKSASGQVGVPNNWVDTAWYDQGTHPGGVGSAVIDGHISSVNGPAVFFHLHNLKPGDKVIVMGTKGQKLTFAVVQVTAYPRNNAPLQRIFGDFNTRTLNLITCAGLWDGAAHTHEDRLVVYTQLVDETV